MVGACGILAPFRRTEPKLPVERFRDWRRFARPAVSGRVRLWTPRREKPHVADFADPAATYDVCRPAVALPGGDLSPHLGNDLLLGSEARDGAAFGEVVAQGLLSIDVQPALERFDDVLRVGVVGRRDVHGIDLVAFGGEHLERVPVDPRVGEAPVRLFEIGGIHVAERGDVDFWMRCDFAQVVAGLVAAPDRGVGKHFAWLPELEYRRESACRKKCRRRSCRAQKRAPAHDVSSRFLHAKRVSFFVRRRKVFVIQYSQ